MQSIRTFSVKQPSSSDKPYQRNVKPWTQREFFQIQLKKLSTSSRYCPEYLNGGCTAFGNILADIERHKANGLEKIFWLWDSSAQDTGKYVTDVNSHHPNLK